LRHCRRELLWLGVTAHPNAEWIARQLTEPFRWRDMPRYLIRDRDCAYGQVLIRRVGALGIRDRPISARSPWQNGFAERLIGSIRRDCLDQVIVFGERHLDSYSTHIIIRRMRTRLPTCLSIGLGDFLAILLRPVQAGLSDHPQERADAATAMTVRDPAGGTRSPNPQNRRFLAWPLWRCLMKKLRDGPDRAVFKNTIPTGM
jgi:hypothetical protein